MSASARVPSFGGWLATSRRRGFCRPNLWSSYASAPPHDRNRLGVLRCSLLGRHPLDRLGRVHRQQRGWHIGLDHGQLLRPHLFRADCRRRRLLDQRHAQSLLRHRAPDRHRHRRHRRRTADHVHAELLAGRDEPVLRRPEPGPAGLLRDLRIRRDADADHFWPGLLGRLRNLPDRQRQEPDRRTRARGEQRLFVDGEFQPVRQPQQSRRVEPAAAHGAACRRGPRCRRPLRTAARSGGVRHGPLSCALARLPRRCGNGGRQLGGAHRLRGRAHRCMGRGGRHRRQPPGVPRRCARRRPRTACR